MKQTMKKDYLIKDNNMNKPYGFIYITTNNINGKKYIGQKKYDTKEYWKYYLGSGIRLKRAIDKYGRENFSKEIIENCYSKDELSQREVYWINYYNAVNDDNFYNIAQGGEGGNVVAGYSTTEYNRFQKYRLSKVNISRKMGEECSNSKLTNKQVLEIIDKLKQGEFVADIAREYNTNPNVIYDIRLHKTWKHLTKRIVFPETNKRKCVNQRGKKVAQYDLNKNLINIFLNARIATQQTGVSYKNISQVCRGERLTAGGYYWEFYDLKE